MYSIKHTSFLTVYTVIMFLFFSSSTFASEEDDEMAAMQRMLNQRIMASPFDPGDPARVDAYIKEAMKKDLQPASAPNYWQRGYTCNYIRQYRYVYSQYRNCLYYYRYYGRYWGQPAVAVQPVVVQPTVVTVPATKIVVVEKPTEIRVRKTNHTIEIDDFDEDALNDYYDALKSAVTLLSTMASVTPEQFEQMTSKGMSGQWSMALSGIVTSQLESAKIELESWPLSARQTGWKSLGKKITRYNKLFEKHRSAILANDAIEEKIKNSIKDFELVSSTTIFAE